MSGKQRIEVVALGWRFQILGEYSIASFRSYETDAILAQERKRKERTLIGKYRLAFRAFRGQWCADSIRAFLDCMDWIDLISVDVVGFDYGGLKVWRLVR